MVTVEIRIEETDVRVRRFGSAKPTWHVVRPGESDCLTGWSCEELRGLGDGVWQFAEQRRNEPVEV